MPITSYQRREERHITFNAYLTTTRQPSYWCYSSTKQKCSVQNTRITSIISISTYIPYPIPRIIYTWTFTVMLFVVYILADKMAIMMKFIQ